MYSAAKTLSIMRQVKLIRKKEFATIAFDLKNEAFVVQVAFINKDLGIYLFYIAQIAFSKLIKLSSLSHLNMLTL